MNPDEYRIRMEIDAFKVKVKRIFGWILTLLGTFIILYIRLNNIDMSETRLFITYCFPLISSSASIVYGAWLVSK